MLKLKSLTGSETRINGVLLAARPENYKYRSVWERVTDAWLVFSGRADALVWPGDQ